MRENIPLNQDDFVAAAEQGWTLSELPDGTLQIQRIDDPESLSTVLGVVVPVLDNDDQAVAVMKAACERGEVHALRAYMTMHTHSANEFARLQMSKWGILSRYNNAN